MTPAETAAQLRLAADILETGHPFEWRNEDFPEWHPSNGNSVHHFMDNCVIRPILARPPYEAELLNKAGLNADQVGIGFRLLVANDEFTTIAEYWGGEWCPTLREDGYSPTYTYRLPLSVPWPEKPKSAELTPELAARGYEQYGFGSGITVVEKPDPYAELKKAHAEGKLIQQLSGGVWYDFKTNPCWRYADEKKTVPLGPEDVPPGSVFRRMSWDAEWVSISQLTLGFVVFLGNEEHRTFTELEEEWQINRSIPLTGKWNPDAWEACSKQIDA